MKGWMIYGLAAALFIVSGCSYIGKNSNRIYQVNVNNHRSFDAIIVPGIPYKEREWGGLMKARVLWSYVLYKSGYAKYIIYSGGAVHTPYKEAIVMGLYAQKLGIPPDRILYDTLASHSTGNVYYSYLIAKERGFRKVALATDWAQMGFLRKFLKARFASPIHELPIISDSIDKYEHISVAIDPGPAKVNDFVPIEKWPLLKRITKPNEEYLDFSAYHDGKLPSLHN